MQMSVLVADDRVLCYEDTHMILVWLSGLVIVVIFLWCTNWFRDHSLP